MNERTRKAVRSSSMFGGAFAAWSFLKALPSVIAGTAPVLGLVAAPALTFVIFGGAAFVLLMIGVATTSTKSPGDPNISPWFAWLIAGAFVAFWVGFLPNMNRDHAGRWGELSAAVWTAGVLIAWSIVRLRRRRTSSPSVAAEP